MLYEAFMEHENTGKDQNLCSMRRSCSTKRRQDPQCIRHEVHMKLNYITNTFGMPNSLKKQLLIQFVYVKLTQSSLGCCYFLSKKI